MVVQVIKAKDDKITTADLIADLKKSNKIDYSGVIFTFEGMVRGKDENMHLEKLILSTPDVEKTVEEIGKIVDNTKIKYNVHEISVVHYIGEFYTGDTLFLVAVLGSHRNETLEALKETIENVKFNVEFKKEEISKEGRKTILAGG
ncbi:molybdenum cofactor biosynthesis protein MoaE [Methanobrevibacter sp.]|uniref:molybdenum cofactor biosynthesis protein MoaE n=1 Tax=Methanobrevibacter sp. TaxID=66852 RepID=UPI003863CEB0